jgi:acid phosphatase (class A)
MILSTLGEQKMNRIAIWAVLAAPAGICNLPPPPAPGTAAFQRDLAILHQYQQQRSPEQCAIADRERTISLNAWFGPATGVLTEAEVRRATPAALRVFAIAGAKSAVCKLEFHRLRPYAQDPTIHPCIQPPKQDNQSYPSGHAAVAAAVSKLLTRMYPAKAELIRLRGFQVGEDRVIAGVHFPSDVQAGRNLAQAILDEFDQQ